MQDNNCVEEPGKIQNPKGIWNNTVMRIKLLSIALMLVCIPALGQQNDLQSSAQITDQDLNAVLIQSTFRIEGPGSLGTGFVLGRKFYNQDRWRYVLITAAHVLTEVRGDSVSMYVQVRYQGAWQLKTIAVRIKDRSKPLWTQHPTADVAAMYVSLPEGAIPDGIVDMGYLADDDYLWKNSIHPGDELICLGFPLGSASEPYQFPILRAGRIASHPLLPTHETKNLLLDFPVFPGNSGGPVYFVLSGVRGNTIYTGSNFKIMGLVARERVFANRIPLGIAEIVHATFIRETVEQLPPPGK